MGIVDLTNIEKYILVESTFQWALLIREVWTNFEPSNSLIFTFLSLSRLSFYPI